jgi:DNA ligase-associated metallophosphoesterase
MIVTIRAQTCHLLAQKAVFWEEKKTLILADIHIGKGTVFRKAGIPIPEGIMDDDLNNITTLINHFQAEKCIIVGDLIHAKSGLSEDVKLKVSLWLQSLRCEVHLILGNHDKHLIKNLPQEWSLHTHLEGLLIEPFYFSHFPIPHEKWFVWSGHLHPKVELSNKYDRLVLRCFQIFDNLGILPGFGFFVGGTIVKKSKNCKIYAIADEVVIKV